MSLTKVGDRTVGGGAPPFVVAELGVTHQGSLEIAKKNAAAAVAAGADCVKTETFYETEIFDDSAMKTFSIRGKDYAVPLREHMRRYQFTLDEHHEIKKLCDELGVPFMATAHAFRAVDFLVDIGAAAIKIASPDIVHYPLLRYVAGKDITMFLDTGGAYQHEVEQAVKTIRDAGGERLVVNHNPAGHPAPPERHNLKIIQRFKDLFDVPIGFSDHYDGYEMAYAAVAAGANAVEKPISQNRFIEECEHIWSVSVADLPEFVRNVKNVGASMGAAELSGPGLRPLSPHRVALVARRDMRPGDIISIETVDFGKPRKGIGVEEWDLVAGRPLRRSVMAGSFIVWEDL